MKKLFALILFVLWPFLAQAQTPGAQPEFCVTSPSQTANYNQLCISASSSGGQLGLTSFGSATGALSFTQNGIPIIPGNPGTGLNVVSYGGADPTGVVDATTAFQNTVNEVSALKGGCVFVPAGTFRISGTVTVQSGANLCGSGTGSLSSGVVSNIVGTGTNQTIFQIGDGATNPIDIIFEGVSISYSSAQASGAAVRVRNGHNITVRDVTCNTNMHTCIQLDGGAQQFGYHVDHIEVSSGAFGILVGSAGGNVQDLWINDSVLNALTTGGISLQFATGVYGKHVDIINSATALQIVPGNGQFVGDLNLVGYFLDTSANFGLDISPTGTGYAYLLSFVELWAATTSAGPGVHITAGGAGVAGVNFTGGRIVNNNQDGVQLTGGTYVSFTGVQVGLNSQAGSAMFSGYAISAGVSDWSITGGVAGGIVFPSLPTNNQAYGINIASGASNHFSVCNVDMTRNGSGTINNGATGTDYGICGPGYGNPIATGQNNPLLTGAASFTTITSGNTGFENALRIQNSGTTTNSSTKASLYTILSGCANCFIALAAQGDASTPKGILTSGAGLTGGFTFSTNAGSIIFSSAAGVNIAAAASNNVMLTAGAGGFDILTVGATNIAAANSGAFFPWTDNTFTLGGSSLKWSQVYGVAYFTGTGATAGASCTLTTVSHLTVVNGIVTLCN